MLWLVLILVAIGAAFYIVDKKIKEKYSSEKKFNPNDWDIPESIATPVDTALQGITATPVVPEKVVFEKKASVLIPGDENFYNALCAAVADKYIILTNVNAADVLTVVESNNAVGAQVATKSIAGKQFDFVLCEKKTLAAVCAIAVDEALVSFLSNACESARLPVVQLRTQITYDIDQLKEKIFQVIGQHINQTSATLSEPKINAASDPLEINSSVPEPAQVEVAENGLELNFCPNCSAVMLKRKAKSGSNAGKMFWICSTYPTCRGMKSV
ncbi:MAG: DUF2726 domain-containing protein [Gammaproteobacteria bacterium]|nr:MAG: DUF2726 domain-containing protein [Gammaproteobacteria bacterium]